LPEPSDLDHPSVSGRSALAGSGHGDGTSIADVPDEDLLEGFGE
jgi:hypothetical protein